MPVTITDTLENHRRSRIPTSSPFCPVPFDTPRSGVSTARASLGGRTAAWGSTYATLNDKSRAGYLREPPHRAIPPVFASAHEAPAGHQVGLTQ